MRADAKVRYEVVTPEGASPGDKLKIAVASGVDVELELPEGAMPGSKLRFTLPNATAGNEERPMADKSIPNVRQDHRANTLSSAGVLMLEEPTTGSFARTTVNRAAEAEPPSTPQATRWASQEHFEVIVPEGSSAGDHLQVMLSSSNLTAGWVEIPPGAAPGSVLIFSLPEMMEGKHRQGKAAAKVQATFRGFASRRSLSATKPIADPPMAISASAPVASAPVASAPVASPAIASATVVISPAAAPVIAAAAKAATGAPTSAALVREIGAFHSSLLIPVVPSKAAPPLAMTASNGTAAEASMKQHGKQAWPIVWLCALPMALLSACWLVSPESAVSILRALHDTLAFLAAAILSVGMRLYVDVLRLVDSYEWSSQRGERAALTFWSMRGFREICAVATRTGWAAGTGVLAAFAVGVGVITTLLYSSE